MIADWEIAIHELKANQIRFIKSIEFLFSLKAS